MTRKTFLSALLASLALFLPASAAQAQGACLSPQEIQNAHATGQILRFEQVRANLPPDMKVVGEFKVCDQGGQLYYIIPVLQGGNAQTISLNASTGRP